MPNITPIFWRSWLVKMTAVLVCLMAPESLRKAWDIRRTSQLKEGEDAVGNRVKVKVVKNKLAPPFRKAEFDIMFGEGISRTGEIVDLGTEFNIIKKSGSWFSYGDTKLAQGRDAVKKLLEDNPELAEEIKGKIADLLKEKGK